MQVHANQITMKSTFVSLVLSLLLAATASATTLQFWDTNGTAAGAGSATPTGTWGVDPYWNTDGGGVGTGTTAWTAGDLAVFAAGNDAVGAYTVYVQNTIQVGDIHVDLGNVTFEPAVGGSSFTLADQDGNNVGRLLSVGHKDPNSVATYNVPLTGADGIIRYKRGTLILGVANSYSGSTTIEGGVLQLGASDVIPDGSNLILANNDDTRGDFDEAWRYTPAVLATDGFSETLGTLRLSGTDGTVQRALDFGNGASALAFADSSAEDWGGFELTILNFTEGADTLRFGTSSSGLTGTQLDLFRFADFGNVSGQIDALGYVTPIPEPTAFCLLALGGSALTFLLRRRRNP
jgi:autotransporter-associated beta strand protein